MWNPLAITIVEVRPPSHPMSTKPGQFGSPGSGDGQPEAVVFPLTLPGAG